MITDRMLRMFKRKDPPPPRPKLGEQGKAS
jgi:hypothetical protein